MAIVQKAGATVGWIAVSILWLVASEGWAQQIEQPQPNPAPGRTPKPCRGRSVLRAESYGGDRAAAGHAAVDPRGRGPADRPGKRAPAGQRPEPGAERRPPAHHGSGRDAATRRGLLPAVDQSRHELRLAHRQLAAIQRQYPVGEPIGGVCRCGQQRRGRGHGRRSRASFTPATSEWGSTPTWHQANREAA